MELKWTEQLSVGNAIIDSDHKRLIEMANGAMYMIKKGVSHALAEAFEQLEQHMRAHFANEQMVAQAIHFPFHQNNLEHEIVLLTFLHLKDLIQGKKGVFEEGAAEHFCELLGDWLINHITREDMRMKPFLQSFPYDFIPAEFHPAVVQTEASLQL